MMTKRLLRQRILPTSPSSDASHLQTVSYPPVEDGQVGLRGENQGRQIDLVAPAGDGNHLQMNLLQRSCE